MGWERLWVLVSPTVKRSSKLLHDPHFQKQFLQPHVVFCNLFAFRWAMTVTSLLALKLPLRAQLSFKTAVFCPLSLHWKLFSCFSISSLAEDKYERQWEEFWNWQHLEKEGCPSASIADPSPRDKGILAPHSIWWDEVLFLTNVWGWWGGLFSCASSKIDCLLCILAMVPFICICIIFVGCES